MKGKKKKKMRKKDIEINGFQNGYLQTEDSVHTARVNERITVQSMGFLGPYKKSLSSQKTECKCSIKVD